MHERGHAHTVKRYAPAARPKARSYGFFGFTYDAEYYRDLESRRERDTAEVVDNAKSGTVAGRAYFAIITLISLLPCLLNQKWLCVIGPYLLIGLMIAVFQGATDRRVTKIPATYTYSPPTKRRVYKSVVFTAIVGLLCTAYLLFQ